MLPDMHAPVADLRTIPAVLLHRAKEVGAERIASAEIQDLVRRLLAARLALAGGGIAAPQIGVGLRVFVAEYDAATRQRYPHKRDLPRTVAIDPRLEFPDDVEEEIWEGCLSQPDLRGPVQRRMRVVLHAWDEHGLHYRREFTGLAAGTIQHEYDHLDGITFPMRVADRSRMVDEATYWRDIHPGFLLRAESISRHWATEGSAAGT